MKTTNTTTGPSLYVGTYAKYNAGSIAGAWLDLSYYSDRDEFLTACAELHADESDPEIMFQDFEGFPRCWYCESSAPPDLLWEWLELDEHERAAFAIFANNENSDVTIEQFRESYQGTADSEADFAERMAEDCGEIPKDLPSWICIDWEASWNSALRFDYWSERDEDGELHFFRNI